jgi:hypothetical protein
MVVLSIFSPREGVGHNYVGHFQSNAPLLGNKYWSNNPPFCNKYYINKSHFGLNCPNSGPKCYSKSPEWGMKLMIKYPTYAHLGLDIDRCNYIEGFFVFSCMYHKVSAACYCGTFDQYV